MQIIPAILTEDCQEAIAQLEILRGVSPWVQIDVADATMTESKTFDLYELVGELDGFDVEVHLMTSSPETYFDACDTVGARRVYVHPEPLENVSDILEQMKEYPFACGLSVSPQTAVEQISPYLGKVDAVQIMTVTPGAQGGEFLSEMLEKVVCLKKTCPRLWVAVDGGVNEITVKEIRRSGADAAGVGSAISQAVNPIEAYRKLASLARY